MRRPGPEMGKRGVDRYLPIVSSPRVVILLLSALIVYIGFAGRHLAIVFLMADQTGSYASAGAAAGVSALGGAICAPLRGRALDRFGQTRLIVPLALVYGIAFFAALAVLLTSQGNMWLVLLLMGTGGAAFPSVFASMRAIWAEYYRDDQAKRSAAYALEAAVQELSFILGPLLVGALAITVAGSTAAFMTCTTLVSAGALVFASSPLSRTWTPSANTHRGFLGALSGPGIRTLAGSMAFFGAAMGVLYVSIPFLTRGEGYGSLAGPVLAGMSLCSMAAGIWYGARVDVHNAGRQYILLLFIAVATTALLPFGQSLWIVTPVILVAGAVISPIFIVVFHLLDVLAPVGTATESSTWITQGYGVGAGVGSAAAGFMAQEVGLQWSMALVCLCAALSLLVAWTFQQTIMEARRI